MRYGKTILAIIGLLLLVCTIPVSASSEPSITIHIYRDGSIVAEGSYTLQLPEFGITYYGEGYSTMNIKCGENDFIINLVGYEESPIFDFNGSIVSIAMEYNRVPNDNQPHDKLKLILNMLDNLGNSTKITLNLEGTTDIDTLNGTYSGRVFITATGLSSREIINDIANLSVEDVGLFLALMGVQLTSFDVKTTGNSADIKVSLIVDYKTFYQIEDEEKLRKIMSEMNIPLSISFSIKMRDNITEYSLLVSGGEDINLFMDTLLTMPNSTLNLLSESKISIPSATLDDTALTMTLHDFMKIIHENFDIMPSKGKLVIKTVKDKTVIEFKTPRMLSKNTTSFEAGIKAFRDVLAKLSNNNPSVMKTRVLLEPEDFNAQILVKGKPSRVASLSELSDVTIIPVEPSPTTSITATPQPSMVNTRDMYRLVSYGIIAGIIAVLVIVLGLKIIRK